MSLIVILRASFYNNNVLQNFIESKKTSPMKKIEKKIFPPGDYYLNVTRHFLKRHNSLLDRDRHIFCFQTFLR